MNQALGRHPNIGPFPADQLLPWVAIAGASYYLIKVGLGQNWVVTGAVAFWGISTWWILTAKGAWWYLSKFIPVPKWSRGFARFTPLLAKTPPRSSYSRGKKQ
ncbi:hypothetical protein [Laspinema olomoucense]|uniref:hypothetical protein n=1 Tax=Laspinema olomoucense TaxID=3231600 RepID=UPI0021BA575D|nr:hypothetical protein [Laspinema sp. D3a]